MSYIYNCKVVLLNQMMKSFDIITKTDQFEFSAKEFIDRYLLRGHYEIFLKDLFRKNIPT